jgi:phenylalanyl-tRNA synthetase alpha subunit
MDVIGKALDERFAMLNDSFQQTVKNLEQYLSLRLHNLRDEYMRTHSHTPSYNGSMTNVQEVLHGIEHLERIIESMQVAMTANHALLSNRLYHHQQLPLERAHPGNQAHDALNISLRNSLPIAQDGAAQDQAARAEEVKEE